ncbi:MAG: peptidase T [Elusimicrobiota bacterium]
MNKEILKRKLFDRLKKYCEIETTSDPKSLTYPSTASQTKFAKILLKELKEIGVKKSFMDKYSYIFGKIDSNCNSQKKIAFIAHMDTSPAYTAKRVKVKLYQDYKGNRVDIGEGLYLDTKNCPVLKEHIGHDIVTASGNTLLGADDKAGIAIIMTLVEYLLSSKDIKYPNIRILFTPDEEIGRGVDKLDLKKLDADFGYTFDGDLLGTVEKENFNADGVKIKVYGKSVHPGSAKNQMANAVRILSDIISSWPENMTPENTEGYDGFIMFDEIKGDISYAEAGGIVREHNIEKLKYMEKLLLKIVEEKKEKYSLAKIEIDFIKQYRNMKNIIDKYPEVMSKLFSAMKNAGVEPRLKPIRGGTDGSRLSFMGLPTPNVFTGGYNYHGPYEWISLDSMLKSFEVAVNLCKEWSK